MNQESICENEGGSFKKSTARRRDASRISCTIWIFPTRFKVMYFPISSPLLIGYVPRDNKVRFRRIKGEAMYCDGVFWRV